MEWSDVVRAIRRWRRLLPPETAREDQLASTEIWKDSPGVGWDVIGSRSPDPPERVEPEERI